MVTDYRRRIQNMSFLKSPAKVSPFKRKYDSFSILGLADKRMRKLTGPNWVVKDIYKENGLLSISGKREYYSRTPQSNPHIVQRTGAFPVSKSKNVSGLKNLSEEFNRGQAPERVILRQYPEMSSSADELNEYKRVVLGGLSEKRGNSNLQLGPTFSCGNTSAAAAAAAAAAGSSKKAEPKWKQLLAAAKARNPQDSVDREAELLEAKLKALQVTRKEVWESAQKKKSEFQKEKSKDVSDAFRKLTSDAEEAVDEVLTTKDRQNVLVMHEPSNIDITGAVIQCLLPGAWLNDEVINLYMDLLKEREVREPNKFLRCHFFNSFFYNKLFKDKGKYDYKAVRRWTTQRKLGYALHDCEKIFIPVHKDVHWCLAVINLRERKFEYLDSLKGGDDHVLSVLAKYIVDEVKDKGDIQLDVSDWSHEYPQQIPEQMNGCDCGMFMIKYADFHSRGASLCFSQADMPYFRRRTVWEILKLTAA